MRRGVILRRKKTEKFLRNLIRTRNPIKVWRNEEKVRKLIIEIELLVQNLMTASRIESSGSQLR